MIAVIGALVGWLVGTLLGWIPVIGFVVGLILKIAGTIVDVYAIGGIGTAGKVAVVIGFAVFAIISFMNLAKEEK